MCDVDSVAFSLISDTFTDQMALPENSQLFGDIPVIVARDGTPLRMVRDSPRWLDFVENGPKPVKTKTNRKRGAESVAPPDPPRGARAAPSDTNPHAVKKRRTEQPADSDSDCQVVEIRHPVAAPVVPSSTRDYRHSAVPSRSASPEPNADVSASEDEGREPVVSHPSSAAIPRLQHGLARLNVPPPTRMERGQSEVARSSHHQAGHGELGQSDHGQGAAASRPRLQLTKTSRREALEREREKLKAELRLREIEEEEEAEAEEEAEREIAALKEQLRRK